VFRRRRDPTPDGPTEADLGTRLTDAWDDADGLHTLIVETVNAGEPAAVAAASGRLLELEPGSERAITARAIVLMETGDLDQAEAVLRAQVNDGAGSSIVLANLAKLAGLRGNEDQVDALLWDAVAQDPNFETTLSWWAGLARETGGADAERAALTRVAALPGAWRAAISLARRALDDGDDEGAMPWLLTALATADPAAVLAVITELRGRGRPDQALDLVLPLWSPADGQDVSTALIEAAIEANRPQDGARLIARLSDDPELAAVIEPYATTIDAITAIGAPRADVPGPPLPPSIAPTVVDVVAIARPLWHRYLERPDWLLPEDASGPRLVIASLIEPMPLGADARGRALRVAPLVIAEELSSATDVDPLVLLGIARDPQSPTLDWPLETMLTAAGTQAADIAMVVCVTNDVAGLALRVVDTRTSTVLATLSSGGDGVDDAVLDLRDALVDWLVERGSAQARTRPGHNDALPREHVAAHLAAHDLLVAAALSGSGLAAPLPDAVQRDALHGCFELAVRERGSIAPQLLFAAGLGASHRTGAHVWEEFRAPAMALIEAAVDPGSVVHRVAPFIYRLYALRDAYHARREQLLDAWDDEVIDWLRGLDRMRWPEPEAVAVGDASVEDATLFTP